MWVTRLSAAACIAAVVVGGIPAAAMTRAAIVTVSVSRSGGSANGMSEAASLSEGGRYIAFTSHASNLVAGDTNGEPDVFVRDRRAGTTERVSVSSSRSQANLYSSDAVISANGRYVAFASSADNLVHRDTNGTGDVFVHDRRSGSTERVSVSSSGRQTGDHSWDPVISADGRYVAFTSDSSGLVPGDTTNYEPDVYLRDRRTGTTEWISVSPPGAPPRDSGEEPAISADGRFVAFVSRSRGLVPGDTNDEPDIVVRDRLTGGLERVNVSDNEAQANGMTFQPAISGDGRHVAFSSYATNLTRADTNNESDVFVRDRSAGTTSLISVPPTGETSPAPMNDRPAISRDGRYIVFESVGSESAGVFVRDRQTSTTTRLAPKHSGDVAISGNGRCVAFTSDVLIPPDDTGRDVDIVMVRL